MPTLPRAALLASVHLSARTDSVARLMQLADRSIADLSADADPSDVAARAEAVQAAVCRAVALLLECQLEAGRLLGFAAASMTTE